MTNPFHKIFMHSIKHDIPENICLPIYETYNLVSMWFMNSEETGLFNYKILSIGY